MNLNVYIPKQEISITGLELVKGTAIVEARAFEDGRSLCFFEGNLYGADNLNSFGSKAAQAAARIVEQYPTVVKCAFNRDDLILVGYFDTDELDFHPITDDAVVVALYIEWTGEEPVEASYIPANRLIKLGVNGSMPEPIWVLASKSELAEHYSVGKTISFSNVSAVVTHFEIAA